MNLSGASEANNLCSSHRLTGVIRWKRTRKALYFCKVGNSLRWYASRKRWRSFHVFCLSSITLSRRIMTISASRKDRGRPTDRAPTRFGSIPSTKTKSSVIRSEYKRGIRFLCGSEYRTSLLYFHCFCWSRRIYGFTAIGLTRFNLRITCDIRGKDLFLVPLNHVASYPNCHRLFSVEPRKPFFLSHETLQEILGQMSCIIFLFIV